GKDITIEGSGQIVGKASKDMILKGKKILQN
ncbi:MAG: type IV secretion protein Rhs, partial [Acidobacteria bacterium]